MHDEIAHVGVVDCPLGSTLPGSLGRRVVGKDADNVEFVEIFELNTFEIRQFTAEYEMEELLGLIGIFIRHTSDSLKMVICDGGYALRHLLSILNWYGLPQTAILRSRPCETYCPNLENKMVLGYMITRRASLSLICASRRSKSETPALARLFSSAAFYLIAGMLVFFTAFSPEAHAEKVIKWTNLLPQAAPLKDPFNTLTQDQRFDIETIIWARSLSTEERALDHNRQPVEDAAKYEREFRKAGLNIEKLLKDQAVFSTKTAQRQNQVNSSLNGKDVKIAGYLLPLEFSEKAEKDFLLVPYVGACVHVPPPPANQLVLIRLAKGMQVKDLYTPVWISGQMKTKMSSKALNLADGSRDVSVGYHIDAANAEIYKDK